MSEAAAGLRESRYWAGSLASAAVVHPQSPDWADFAASWRDLPMDTYMADGGKYRFRRYAEFRAVAGSAIAALPHRAYHQARSTNYLNGDVERMFAPVAPATLKSPVLHSLLGWAVDVLERLTSHPEWFVQAFQNRIVASGVPGKPTPEGIHRDGVDYVLTVMVERSGIAGGDSELYSDVWGKRKVASVKLLRAGECIINDDKALFHGVVPVEASDSAVDGYRDVLVAIFTAMVDGKIPVTGE